MIVDGHAHLYPCFDPGQFLAAAVANLSAHGTATPDGRGETCVLLLTETPRENVFDAFADGHGVPAGWSADPADPTALWLNGPKGARLLLVAGRQIVTAERLEVLAIGYGADAGEFERRSIQDVTAALTEAGHPVILPWGLGKWTGSRERALNRYLAAGMPSGVFLGDNAGRPSGWPTPRAFQSGSVVLPGSDPLPVSSAANDVGRFGFRLDGEPDPDEPGRSICDHLITLTRQPEKIGTRLGPAQVLDRQIRLRLL